MRRSGLYWALALLLLINMVVLVGVARNRTGTPVAMLDLTERELPLVLSVKENSGIALRLAWQEGNRRDKTAGWFDQAKLSALGFDCRLPLADPRAEEHYRKFLPRQTFAVLEYQGKRWENWRAAREKELAAKTAKMKAGKETKEDLENERAEFARELLTISRLFAIDAGNDPAELRRRYPEQSRYLVAPAKVRMIYSRPIRERGKELSPPSLTGFIEGILVDEIHVPKGKRPVLDRLIVTGREKGDRYYGSYRAGSIEAQPPRYRVSLCYGRRYEPWITDITPL